jgi:hypothetical protein
MTLQVATFLSMRQIAECIDCTGINFLAMPRALIAERIIFDPWPNVASGCEDVISR